MTVPPLATTTADWPATSNLGLFTFTDKATHQSCTWLVLRTNTDPVTGERWVFLAHPDDPSQAELAFPRKLIGANYRVVPA